ncbi:MAG: tetratricopeptide repeat protein [Sphingomonadaceae bacterium]
MLKRILMLSAGLAAVLASPAQAEVDPLVRQALDLHSNGRAGEAYGLLALQEDARSADPDYNYILGLAAADSGRAAEAILAFQRVLAVQPDHAQARAELARVYAMAGDIDTAREQFDTVVSDPSLPDPVRQRFDRIVRDYDRQIAGGGSSVSGFVDVSGGYDSNINGATDADAIVIPLFAGFGPGTLGPAAREQDKGFYEVQAGVSGVTAVSRQTRLFASLLGNWRDNIDSRAFDQAAITGTAGLGHTLANRDVLSFSLQGQQFWFGQRSFRQSVGGIGQYTKRLKNGEALSFSGEFFRLNFDNDPLRDADRYSVGISYAARTMILSLSGGHEETRRAAGDHLSYDYARLNVAVEQPIGTGLAVVAGIGGQLRRHDAADPLFLAQRKDEQVDLSLGLKVRLTDNLYARPRVTYTRNWSNFALYDYERATVSLGIRHEF